jgi:hypothetical protein
LKVSQQAVGKRSYLGLEISLAQRGQNADDWVTPAKIVRCVLTSLERYTTKLFSKFLRRWQMMPPPFSKKTMIQSGKDYLGKVPVEVEVTIGDTWAEK